MPAVLVTGASTGIGRATALWMDRQGWTVYAGVRKQADADALTEAGSDRLHPVILDVTRPEQLAAVKARLEAELGDQGLHGLVNNAGIGNGGAVEVLAEEAVRRVLEVNLFGVIRCTKELLPLLRKSGRGRIVNVSSIGGRWAGPFLSPYHMSKWALEAFSDSLRMELHDQPVEVSVIEPGTIKTEIWQKAEDTTRELLEGLDDTTTALYGEALRKQARVIAGQPAIGVSPDVVAERIAHALTADRPHTRYLVGPGARAIAWLKWLLPDRAFDAVMRTVLERRSR